MSSATCYATWSGQLNLSMRQVHVYGDKSDVNFAGMTVPMVNAATGEVTQAQIFAGVLGARNYT